MKFIPFTINMEKNKLDIKTIKNIEVSQEFIFLNDNISFLDINEEYYKKINIDEIIETYELFSVDKIKSILSKKFIKISCKNKDYTDPFCISNKYSKSILFPINVDSSNIRLYQERNLNNIEKINFNIKEKDVTISSDSFLIMDSTQFLSFENQKDGSIYIILTFLEDKNA